MIAVIIIVVIIISIIITIIFLPTVLDRMLNSRNTRAEKTGPVLVFSEVPGNNDTSAEF